MRRREFITGLGSTAIAWPFDALAQQQALPSLAVLFFGHESIARVVDAAFREGLGEFGYRDSQNVQILDRSTESYDRLPELYGALRRRGVAIIASMGAGSPLVTATAATPTIPVVFLIGEVDAKGLLTGLDRPAGNAAKRFGALVDLLPVVKTIGYLHNPTVGVAEARIKAVEAAARAHNVQLVVGNAGNPYEIEPAFKGLVAQNMGALVFGDSPLFIARTEQLVKLASRYAVPAIYPYREQVEAGGLMSYGSSIFDAWRLAGIYAGRILKKERAGNFPAQQSGKIELVINMRTAKALDLVVPNALVSRANHVI